LYKLRELNCKKIAEYEKVLILPPFVENHPVLKKIWTDFHEKHIKNMLPFTESLLLPPSSN